MSKEKGKLNKTDPEQFTYRPRVNFGDPDFVVKIGPYPAAFFSSAIETAGLMTYHHILVVGNEVFKEILFIAAESNPMDGETIYLGQFTPEAHWTLMSSPLLALGPVFFAAACRLTRVYLELDAEQAPLTEAENQALAIIPELCEGHFPGWEQHEGSKALLNMIASGLPVEQSGLAQQGKL